MLAYCSQRSAQRRPIGIQSYITPNSLRVVIITSTTQLNYVDQHYGHGTIYPQRPGLVIDMTTYVQTDDHDHDDDDDDDDEALQTSGGHKRIPPC